MKKGEKVKPREFDHKSKMRLIEHGEEWMVESETIRKEGVVNMILLKSLKDNYLKWWKLDYV